MESLQTTQVHTLYLNKEAVKMPFYENDANADNKQQNQAQELPDMPWETAISSPKYMMSPGGKATHWAITRPKGKYCLSNVFWRVSIFS